METNLLFNISFDLSGIALLIFIIWFIKSLRNHQSIHNWLVGAITFAILSLMTLSYGALLLTKQDSKLPVQTRNAISALHQEMITHKSSSSSKAATKKTSHKHHSSSKKTHSKKSSSSSSNSKEMRIANQNANNDVLTKVQKHSVKVELIAKVSSIDNDGKTLHVRGVHSGQEYTVHASHAYKKIKNNYFIIIHGLAKKVNDQGVIIVKGHRITIQTK